MKILKSVLSVLTCVTLSASAAAASFANMDNRVNTYAVEDSDVKKLNLAILLDASGSILDHEYPSDPELLSRDAASSMLNAVPANNDQHYTQCAIFQFSNEMQMISTLQPLDDEKSYEKMGSTIEDMTKCAGATHMVDAIGSVCDYLDKNSDEDTKNLLLVFTDGAENGVVSETVSDEKIDEVVAKSVGDTNVEVYSLAYDYILGDGVHSVGDENGYGYKILKSYAEKTNGAVGVANKTDEFYEQFKKLIASYFGEDAESVDSEFNVDAEVFEADLSVTTSNMENIVLTKPDGTVVDLKNNKDNNIWVFSTDYTVDIKILLPDEGKWRIESKEKNDKFNTLLIKYHDISMKIASMLDGKETTEVHVGNNADIVVSMFSKDREVDINKLSKVSGFEAYAYVSDKISLKNNIKNRVTADIVKILEKASGGKGYKLEVKDGKLCTKVPVTFSGTNLVSVFVKTDTYNCYDEISLSGDDSIFQTKEPETVYITNGQSAEIKNLISAYCNTSDVTVSVDSGFDAKVIDAELKDDTFKINARKLGETALELTFSSKNNDSKFSFEIPVVVTNSAPVLDFDELEAKVYVGDSYSFENLTDRVDDYENDNIRIRVLDISDDEVADANVANDTITIDGLKEGECEITVNFDDGENSVHAMIYVTVSKSLISKLLPFIIGGVGLLLLVLIIILISQMGKNYRNKLIEFKVFKHEDGSYVIDEEFIPIDKSLKGIVDNIGNCQDFDFKKIEALKSIEFTKVKKSNEVEKIVAKGNDMLSMSFESGMPPMDGFYSYGKKTTSKIAESGFEKFFKIDIRTDKSTEEPAYTITFKCAL